MNLYGALSIGAIVSIIVVLLVIAMSMLIFIIVCYKKCPANKIMVVYGRLGKDKDGKARGSMCFTSGAVFIIPIFQSYQFLDRAPIAIDITLNDVRTNTNEKINIKSRFTVAISSDEILMGVAAQALLGLTNQQISELVHDIIVGQLRLSAAKTPIESFLDNGVEFLQTARGDITNEVNKIGIDLVNAHIIEIDDSSGYLDALHSVEDAKKLQEAKMRVAEMNRDRVIFEAREKLKETK